MGSGGGLTDERVAALVGGIYDAAVDPSLWPATLLRICGAFDSAAAALFATGFDGRIGFCYPVGGLPDAGSKEWKEYDSYYLSIDPRVRFLNSAGRAVGVDYLHTDEQDMDRHEYYAWLGHVGLRYYMGADLLRDRNCHAFIGLQRTPKEGHVQQRDIDLFERLLPHLRRALRIQQELGSALQARAAALEALNQLRTGVILIAADGTAMFLNGAAERLLRRHDGLSLEQQRPTAARPEEARALARLLGEVLKTGRGAGTHPGGKLFVTRPSQRRPYAVLVTPLSPAAFRIMPAPPVAALFVEDPDLPVTVPPEIFRAYGLTPAEARLAAALASGETIDSAAAAFGVSKATLRSQLLQIFRKTGTSRQAELVLLAARHRSGLLRSQGQS